MFIKRFIKNSFYINKFCQIINLFLIIQYKTSQKFYFLIINRLSNIKIINKTFNNKKDFSYFKLLKIAFNMIIQAYNNIKTS